MSIKFKQVRQQHTNLPYGGALPGGGATTRYLHFRKPYSRADVKL